MMSDLTDTLKTSHAAESQHWYDRDGNPCYTQTAKAGHERATTLRDARKLDLVPSVTSIIKEAAKPQLENWKQNQVLLAALTLPQDDGESESDWVKRVMADSKEHAIQAAAKGTEIHAALQGSFEGQAYPEYNAHISAVENALWEWGSVPASEWAAEQSFSHPLGFGGKCDLSAGVAELGRFVTDFKTKEFGPDDKLKAWDEHAMQLASYRLGLGLPDARCSILYVSVNNPGHVQLIEISEDELQRGWAMFEALLSYWKNKKKFDSGWGG